jgi:hypothetical protein
MDFGFWIEKGGSQAFSAPEKYYLSQLGSFPESRKKLPNCQGAYALGICSNFAETV